jgi:polyhydroxybutyrate depolymerase
MHTLQKDLSYFVSAFTSICALIFIAPYPAVSQYGPGDYDFSIQQDALERIYKVHVPPSYNLVTPIPLVLAFHGGGGDAEGSIRFFKLNEKANISNFIVAYPQGTGKTVLGKLYGSWNAGRCCPPATENNIDDVAFIDTLLDKMEHDFNIDRQRIFALGMSNGALMVYRLACELSHRIAAIGASGGHDSYDTCSPLRPVPAIHIHGTADSCALYNGGICGGCTYSYYKCLGLGEIEVNQWACRPVPDYIDLWKNINGCNDHAVITYRNGKATCITFDQCLNGSAVSLCTVEGMGHNWAGHDYGLNACITNPNGTLCTCYVAMAGDTCSDINANDAMWDFFNRHPMSGIISEPPSQTRSHGLVIFQNYPNPFDQMTRIIFSISGNSKVTLNIFDLQGTFVNKLINGEMNAGRHDVLWDGTDEKNARVPRGIYFIKIKIGGYKQIKQIVLR